MKGKLVFYQETTGKEYPKWRWRLVAANGNIIADSGQGYESKRGVQKGFEAVCWMCRHYNFKTEGP